MSDEATEHEAQVDKPKVDLSDLVEDEASLTAASALEVEANDEPLSEPDADDKDAQIKYLREQLEQKDAVAKKATLREKALEAITTAADKYEYADIDLLKEAFKKGKNANEILHYAKVTHFAVEKRLKAAEKAVTARAEADVAERYGRPAGTGASSATPLTAGEIAKLSPDEMLRHHKSLKQTDRTQF
jgi:hypothetical protein